MHAYYQKCSLCSLCLSVILSPLPAPSPAPLLLGTYEVIVVFTCAVDCYKLPSVALSSDEDFAALAGLGILPAAGTKRSPLAALVASCCRRKKQGGHGAPFRQYLCYTLFFGLIKKKKNTGSVRDLSAWGYNRSINISVKRCCFVSIRAFHATRTRTV